MGNGLVFLHKRHAHKRLLECQFRLEVRNLKRAFILKGLQDEGICNDKPNPYTAFKSNAVGYEPSTFTNVAFCSSNTKALETSASVVWPSKST